MKNKLFPSFVKTIYNNSIDRESARLPKQSKTKKRVKSLLITLIAISPLLSCSQPSATSETESSAAADQEISAQATGSGVLEVKGNGEDFVRQGFVDKDGWEISFDHVYVTLADIVAAQRDPSFEAGSTDSAKNDGAKNQDVEALTQVKSADAITVDLAAGDEDAEPVMVTSIENAPSGQYNALSWRMEAPTSGESAGYPLVMVGTATKEGETIPFDIKLSEKLVFDCGDFIGDERKGILTNGETAEVEATFHFDHLFGDGEAAANDEINTGALGFGVLADLAEGGALNVTSEDLEARLSPENYNNLKTVLISLGHVGEGHCEATLLEEE